jgi:hypothetical protein
MVNQFANGEFSLGNIRYSSHSFHTVKRELTPLIPQPFNNSHHVIIMTAFPIDPMTTITTYKFIKLLRYLARQLRLYLIQGNRLNQAITLRATLERVLTS